MRFGSGWETMLFLGCTVIGVAVIGLVLSIAFEWWADSDDSK